MPTTLVALASALALLAPAAPPPAASPALPLERAIEAIRPGLVRVEVRLREDRGEMTDASVGRRWCNECGTYHGQSAAGLLADERAVELPGFLIAPDVVVARDPEIPARFIESISVRGEGEAVAATIDGVALDDSAVFLALAAPLPGGRPIAFEAPAGAVPAVSVRWTNADGSWTASAGPAQSRRQVEQTAGADSQWRTFDSDAVFADSAGAPLGVAFRGRRAGADALPLPPQQWRRLDPTLLESTRAATAAQAGGGILHATLHFRSPRSSRGMDRMHYMGDERTIGAELEALALLLEDGRLVVLASLPPDATARLERIEVRDAAGRSHDAAFVATLREVGALVADPSGSLAGGLALDSGDLRRLRDALLPRAQVRLVGRSRLADVDEVRLGSFERGWKDIAMPGGISDAEQSFVFAPDGALAALPLVRRTKVAVRDPWDRDSTLLMPASVLAAELADLAASADPSNIPLSEEAEGRIAWLGVMLQPLDPELAAANGVAELTRGGEFGGIVTFVYPDSPAQGAGIEPGTILTAIRAPGQPRPIEIAVDEQDLGWPGIFPWDRLDDLPAEYFDSVPSPWPLIEDSVAKILTSLGLGTRYELEFVADGKPGSASLEATQSPAHFGNAPRHEEKALGLTVRDLTLEVRQYLQLPPDAPGVVVAKLEPGERAAIAGLRPFEIITEVDDRPLFSAAEFGAALADRKEVRLSVLRADRERVVQLVIGR